MFKIGEFSRLAQVSTRMLRHYDQIGLLEPNHIDEWTSYRYYTIGQLPRLHRLVALKELGFSLEQVAALLQEEDLSADQMRGMLRLRQAELHEEIAQNQQRLLDVESRLQQIEQAGQPSAYEIIVKSLAPVEVASIRRVVPNIWEMGFHCRTMYEYLYGRLKAVGVEALQPEITLYHTEEYRESDLDVEAALPVESVVLQCSTSAEDLQFHILPGAETAACLLYEGPFMGMETAILELLRWVGLHDHTPAGPMRELHLSGPAHVNGEPVESAIVELQLPIAPIQN